MGPTVCVLYKLWIGYLPIVHVHTCTPFFFRISRTAGRIVLKYGVAMHQLAIHFMRVTSGVDLHILTHVPVFRISISGSAGDWMHHAKIWSGARTIPLDMHSTQAKSRGYPRSR